MVRKVYNRPQCFLCELIPVIDQGRHQVAPCPCIEAKLPVLIGEIVLQHHGGSVVERMRQRRFAVNPAEAMLAERKRQKEGRTRSHGIHGRAEVVLESRQR